MHTNKYKYVSILSAMAVLLLLGIYMWMTYRSASRDITERAGNQLLWAVSQKYDSGMSLDTVAMYVDSLLSVAGISRDVTLQQIEGDARNREGVSRNEKVVWQNNERSSSWSMYTKPVSIGRDGSRAIRLALNNPYPELARRLSPLFLISAIILSFFAVIIIQLLRFINEQEQMAELRNDFSYAMVHDMKSPLSSIIMGAHFLHSGKVDDKPQIKEKYYTIIEEEAEHLLALVNKLLTISKLENKKLILNKWDIHIEPIINDLVEKAKAKSTKPIEVKTFLEVKNVLADEQYLTEAIANLIDNAVKYSKDEIELSIKTFDTDRYVLLKVRDNGIGMTKEEQQVIFDKFGRAAIHEKNRKGGVSGFGLGLNYVDQVMRAHGKIALCVALSGVTAFATESGKLAGRAQKSIKAGNFAKGYSQLERALIASRKEADRRSEGRIIIAMGQVRTMSLDYDMADSLLNYVENEGMDRSTRGMLVKAKMALKNATEKYSEAVRLCEGFDEDDLDGSLKTNCKALSIQNAPSLTQAPTTTRKPNRPSRWSASAPTTIREFTTGRTPA